MESRKLENNLYEGIDGFELFRMIWDATSAPMISRKYPFLNKAVYVANNYKIYRESMSESTNMRELGWQLEYHSLYSKLFRDGRPKPERMHHLLSQWYEL